MCRILHFLAALDWVAVSALFVAVVSFFVARKTLLDAEDSWKQQKWFDLYAKADEAYDTFEFYCINYNLLQKSDWSPAQSEDWDKLMFLIRRVHSMAMVFPKHPAIDKLVEATNFATPDGDFEDSQRKLFLDAVQDMREMALLDKTILERRKRTFWSYFKLW